MYLRLKWRRNRWNEAKIRVTTCEQIDCLVAVFFEETEKCEIFVFMCVWGIAVAPEARVGWRARCWTLNCFWWLGPNSSVKDTKMICDFHILLKIVLYLLMFLNDIYLFIFIREKKTNIWIINGYRSGQHLKSIWWVVDTNYFDEYQFSGHGVSWRTPHFSDPAPRVPAKCQETVEWSVSQIISSYERTGILRGHFHAVGSHRSVILGAFRHLFFLMECGGLAFS